MRPVIGTQRRLVRLINIAVLAMAMSAAVAAPVSGPAPAPAPAAQPEPRTVAQLAQLAGEMRAGQFPGLAGIMLSQRGQLLLGAYAPGVRVDQKFDIRSATKSITALLVGIALAQQTKPAKRQIPAIPQMIVTPDSPLSRFFPTALAQGPDSASKQQILLRDLLSMQSGLACNDWQQTSVGHEDLMYRQSDWLQFWLQLPMAHQHGTQFSYCTGNVIALGAVLTQLTGQPVSAFAHQVLLQPLEITDAVFARQPDGSADTGGHLQLSLAQLHRIGQLVLQRGRWQGQQLVPADWIRQMLSVHSRPDDRPQAYGWLWWQLQQSGQPEIWYAHGNGGTFIMLVPELELVVSFVGTRYNNRQQFEPLQLMLQRILPAFSRNAAADQPAP